MEYKSETKPPSNEEAMKEKCNDDDENIRVYCCVIVDEKYVVVVKDKRFPKLQLPCSSIQKKFIKGKYVDFRQIAHNLLLNQTGHLPLMQALKFGMELKYSDSSFSSSGHCFNVFTTQRQSPAFQSLFTFKDKKLIIQNHSHIDYIQLIELPVAFSDCDSFDWFEFNDWCMKPLLQSMNISKFALLTIFVALSRCHILSEVKQEQENNDNFNDLPMNLISMQLISKNLKYFEYQSTLELQKGFSLIVNITTPVIFALISGGNPVDVILKDQNRKYLREMDENGNNPLHYAAILNNFEFIKRKMDCFDTKQKSKAGLCPIHIAMFNGNVKLVKFLLSHSLNVLLETQDGDLGLFDIAILCGKFTSSELQHLFPQNEFARYSFQKREGLEKYIGLTHSSVKLSDYFH